jgi:hypothetical protein
MVKSDASLSKVRDLEKAKKKSSYFPDAGKKRRAFKLESVLQAIDAMNTYLQKRYLEAQALRLAENKRMALKKKQTEKSASPSLNYIRRAPPPIPPAETEKADEDILQYFNPVRKIPGPQYEGAPVCFEGILNGECSGRCGGRDNKSVKDYKEAVRIAKLQLEARGQKMSKQSEHVAAIGRKLDSTGVVPIFPLRSTEVKQAPPNATNTSAPKHFGSKKPGLVRNQYDPRALQQLIADDPTVLQQLVRTNASEISVILQEFEAPSAMQDEVSVALPGNFNQFADDDEFYSSDSAN